MMTTDARPSLGRLGVALLVLLSFSSCWTRQQQKEQDNQQQKFHSQQPASSAACTQPAQLSSCYGQPATLSGQLAGGHTGNPEIDVIHQHPLMNGPGQVQSYFYYPPTGTQMLLISEQHLACDGTLQVSGKLEQVALSCQPGEQRKCAYRNSLLRVSHWSCQP